MSLLGGAWVLLGFFGCMNALIATVGAMDGIRFGTSEASRAEMAQLAEFDDPAHQERVEMAEARIALGKRLALPLALFAVLSIVGGIRLLRRSPRSRTVILCGGVGAILVSAFYALRSMEIALLPAETIELPPGAERAFQATAIAQVLIQSLPVLIGLSLLRHPIVRRFVRREDG